MPPLSDAIHYLLHPDELRWILQWQMTYRPLYRRDETRETPNVKKCFAYLEKTSRSFSTLIQELHPELRMPICLFYLIARGLDTIEDDTSIPAKKKELTLRDFHSNLETDGWHFTENRPQEKDRALLLDFDCVIQEFKLQKPVYKDIIRDIIRRMGHAMADYCLRAESDGPGIDTRDDYDEYCYYAAGVVGEGLTDMFLEAKFYRPPPALQDGRRLQVSMGLFLQKTNIIRDIKEDADDGRRFWPRAVWSKYVHDFEDLLDPEHRLAALNCGSEMVLDALEHVPECLSYLTGVQEQSAFNFCAIPQCMAIATLTLCFRNPDVFVRNVKITKSEACRLMMESTRDLQTVCDVFKRYIRVIRRKNASHDPNFLKIITACDKIETFIESNFPLEIAKSIMPKGSCGTNAFGV
nr:PREDICTED: probable squalene synthase isoform X1 [Bemisia tabaci]